MLTQLQKPGKQDTFLKLYACAFGDTIRLGFTALGTEIYTMKDQN